MDLLFHPFKFREKTMTPTETKQWLKQVFAEVVENMAATETDYAKYFSPDYIQHVDGTTLNYQDFVAHMKAQKMVMKSLKVSFLRMVVEDNKIATVHQVNAVKKNGGEIEAKIIAFFEIKDNKIILCDELTHLIKGDKSDRDLGSRK
jgi:hypothetical protein